MKHKYACNVFELSGIENINESLSTHYIVYKIVNNLNGRYYIGQHKTKNPYDDYMGSGKLILKAQKKYQLSSFTKIILFDFNNFNDMNNKEKELVPLSCCYPNDPMSYNLHEGGNNYELTIELKQKLSNSRKAYYQSLTEDEKIEYRKRCKETWINMPQQKKDEVAEKCRQASLGENNPMYGKNWQDFSTPEKIALHKIHISQAASGKNNPMYGKSIKNHMSSEKYQQWREKHKQQAGENHPCYGTKMLYDLNGNKHYVKIDKIDYYLSIGWKPSKLEIKRARPKDKTNPAYGRKWMHHPETLETVYVKQDNIQYYINIGYEFGVKPKKLKQ